jgi:YhcH/YjgK/YiaL family protein
MIIDQITNLERYIPSLPALKTVHEILESGKLPSMEYGSYTTDNPKVRYNLFTYTTATPENLTFELHKKEVDVQILLSGFETMVIADTSSLRETNEYDARKDAAFVEGTQLITYHATPSTFALFFPGEGHACNLTDGHVTDVVKVVFKILV